MSKQKLIVAVFPLLQSLLKQFRELADRVSSSNSFHRVTILSLNNAAYYSQHASSCLPCSVHNFNSFRLNKTSFMFRVIGSVVEAAYRQIGRYPVDASIYSAAALISFSDSVGHLLSRVRFTRRDQLIAAGQWSPVILVERRPLDGRTTLIVDTRFSALLMHHCAVCSLHTQSVVCNLDSCHRGCRRPIGLCQSKSCQLLHNCKNKLYSTNLDNTSKYRVWSQYTIRSTDLQ